MVAQGSEAGGHGYGHRATITLVPEIVDLVAVQERHTPVLAAGGIADSRGLAAALILGPAGVSLGTRFYATTEALSTPQARDVVAAANGDTAVGTTIYDMLRRYPWPDGYPMSVLRNAITDRWHGNEPSLRDHLDSITAQYQQAIDRRP